MTKAGNQTGKGAPAARLTRHPPHQLAVNVQLDRARHWLRQRWLRGIADMQCAVDITDERALGESQAILISSESSLLISVLCESLLPPVVGGHNIRLMLTQPYCAAQISIEVAGKSVTTTLSTYTFSNDSGSPVEESVCRYRRTGAAYPGTQGAGSAISALRRLLSSASRFI
ncbi:hypothetical protein KCP76_03295 [Salmonella enterica subsp. enterica serovar Weltevreden]|nr:hypothetical protein KCP76_03295 [Salmonella enterica subsp. enterica serovar Weltevreden]